VKDSKKNLDQEVIKMFASFTFVMSSFGDVDDDIGGLGSIRNWFSK
jgi:hypothetical protein